MQQSPTPPASSGAGRTRPAGQTSATGERSPQWLAGTMLKFDLDRELEALRGEEEWKQGGHNAKALVKETSLRVVLVAMKSGAKLPAHRAPAPITIQTLRGHLRVGLSDQAVDVPIGGLLALNGNVEHSVDATEESAFLLTLTWTNVPSAAEDTLEHSTEGSPRKLDVER